MQIRLLTYSSTPLLNMGGPFAERGVAYFHNIDHFLEYLGKFLLVASFLAQPIIRKCSNGFLYWSVCIH